MMKRTKQLVAVAAVALSVSACTPREIRLWQEWHASDPEAAMEFALNLPSSEPAPTSDYSSASSNGRCVGFEDLLAQYNPGWDVSRMSQIMYRESRCQPTVSNSCCHGLLQIHEMHADWIDCVNSQSDLYDPAKNICAAADLWQASGYGAWSTS